MPVDYDQLAKQLGGSVAPPPGEADYDALAKKFGGSSENVSVSFSPSTATEEELRQAAIGGNRPAIDEFHRRHLAESNPTLGAAAEEFINKATSALARSPVEIAKSLPGLAKMAAGAVIGFGDPMHPLAQEARENLKGMIQKIGSDVGEVSAIATDPRGMPLSQYGKAGEAVGSNVGMVAAPALAGAALGPVVAGAGKVARRLVASPEELYQSALKPSTTFSEAKKASILRTGMQEGIPVTKRGLAKTSEMIDDLRTAIDEKIRSFQEANPEASILPEQAAARVETPGGIRSKYESVRKAQNQAAIDEAKAAFLESYPEPLNLMQAQEIKKATYQDIGERSYEKRTGPGVATEKEIARGLKEELEQFIPELKTINAREGALLQFQKTLNRAINREKNHQWFGIGTPIAGAAGTALGGALGGMHGAAIGGTATTLLKYFLDKPSVKSSLAILMNRVRQVQEAGPTIESGGKIIARNLEPIQNARKDFVNEFLPKGAYSAFGQEKGFVKEALRKDPLPPEATTKAIRRRAQEYLDDWEDLSFGKKRTVYTRAGESGPITGRALETEGAVHPSEVPGLSDLPDSVQSIQDAFQKKYGATYNRIKAMAERMAAEDHIARFTLDEATQERIAETAGTDEHAFRKLINEAVTSKLSGADLSALPDEEPVKPLSQRIRSERGSISLGAGPSVIRGYHGGPSEISSFEKSMVGSSTGEGWLGEGFYFSPHADVAKSYGSKTTVADLTLKNPFRFPDDVNPIKFVKEHGGPKAFTRWVKSQGYDGIISGNTIHQIVVFEPDQVRVVRPGKDLPE